MPLTRHTTAALVLIALALTCASAAAQDEPEYVPTTTGETDVAAKQGWDATLSIGANANVSSNDSVIGQPDGSSWTLGFNVKGGLQYINGGHESRNFLNATETFTRTPVVPEFVRTSDLLELESIYYYHFARVQWLGPFARLKLSTSLFKGEDVQPDARDYLVTNIDGSQTIINATRFQLTDPFFPFSLRESLGMFARPLDRSWLKIEFRAGLGAREVFADSQFAVKDNADTPVLEIVELESFTQAGAEVVAEATGQLAGDRVTYGAGAEVLTPFYDSVSDSDQSATDLTNIDLYAKLSFKLVSWASIDYQYKATKQPALLDKFQVQHNLLLTIGYTLLEED